MSYMIGCFHSATSDMLQMPGHHLENVSTEGKSWIWKTWKGWCTGLVCCAYWMPPSQMKPLMPQYVIENIHSEYLLLIYEMDPYDWLILEVWMPKIRQMLSNWSPKTLVIYKACFVIVLYYIYMLYCVWIVRWSILTVWHIIRLVL